MTAAGRTARAGDEARAQHGTEPHRRASGGAAGYRAHAQGIVIGSHRHDATSLAVMIVTHQEPPRRGLGNKALGTRTGQRALAQGRRGTEPSGQSGTGQSSGDAGGGGAAG